MLVPLSIKVSAERRDQLAALAEARSTNPSALARTIIDRYVDGAIETETQLLPLMQASYEDITRALVLVRFVAEKIDKDTTATLLERTDNYLASLPYLQQQQIDGRA